ncbi:MAG TPA: TonB-dependent receptor, partial [Azospirillaceae bacterium]|nr:TonB-dependent receptor [Azospirillaceae bacterium]
DVAGKAAPALKGEMTADEALSRLLAGSGFMHRFTAAGVATLLPVPKAEGVELLDPVNVEGAAISKTATIGAGSPAYAGGQLARGARLGALGNRDVFDAPFSVAAYTRDVIDNQQARTMVEVLRNDPSITVNQNANPGGTDDVFNIRGFLTASGDTSFDGLYGMNSRQPSMEQIDRVELFKGPNALLNGRAGGFSVGGMVNLVPKRATDAPVTTLTTRYMSSGLYGVHADVGRRFGAEKQFGVRVNGAYRTGETSVNDVDKRNDVAALALDYRGDRFRWTADLDYGYAVTDGAFGGTGAATGFALPKAPDPSTLLGQKWSTLDQRKTRFVSRAEWDFADDWTLTVAAGQLDLEERYQFVNPYILNAAGDTLQDVYTGGGLTRNRTVEAAVRGRFDTGAVKHTVAAGASWTEQRFGSVFIDMTDLRSNLYRPTYYAKPAFPALSIPTKTSLTVNRSLFVADEASLFDDRLIITAGLRKTVIETGSYSASTGAKTASYRGDAVTPAVGVAVKPLRNVTVYANYMEALESGGTAPNTAVNRGETLAPMISKQVEAGVKADFGFIGASLAAFRIAKTNALTDPTTLVYAANGEQVHKGLEMSAFGEPWRGVRLLAGLTLLDAEMTRTAGGALDGKQPIGVPPVQARLYGEWDTPWVDGLSLNATLAFASAQKADAANTRSLPDWTRLDLGARYALEVDKTLVTVRFNVENVFDHNYWASVDRGSLYVGAPRTFLLSATANF